MRAQRHTLLPRLRGAAAWLAAQLVVVFIGVYAASWAADAQADAERARRRTQLRRALVTELRDATRNTRNAERGTAALIAFYDSAWTAGGRPPLQPIGDPVRWTPQMWNATVAAGGLELLDVPTFYSLAGFYNELSGGFDLLGRLTRLSDDHLLPLADRPAAVFYQPGAAPQLRREFDWYLQSLRRVNRVAARLTLHGDSLATALAAERGVATPTRSSGR